METRNRNILIVVLGALVVLCCCCMLVFGSMMAFLWPATRTEGPDLNQPSAAIIVVTPVATPTFLMEEPVAPDETGTPPAQNAESTRAGTTPVAGSIVPTATLTISNSLTDASLLAEAEMPVRDLRALALRLKPGIENIPATVNATPPSYKVGDKARFWIENGDTKQHMQVSSTLRYITPHVYMWVQDSLKINLNDLQQSADRFESKTYPTDREFFGSEWTPGVDNDVHLSILNVKGLSGGIVGYFSAADEYSHLINPYSNEREMFYISADKAEPNTSYYDGVLAHEFQHMIHWANDPNEDSWVNEGMSELAEQLNGFDTGGFEIAYARQPDTQLNTWVSPSDGGDALLSSAHYGASFLFMDYFLNRFGEDLTKAVVADKANGIEGFNDAMIRAGRPERFDDIFADWLVANYLDQPDATPKGRFGYQDINPPTPAIAEQLNQFPASGSARASQYGADYIDLKGSGNLTLDFSGQTTAKLVDTNPHGQYAWWGNRGDDADATLTRAFDLSAVSSATLTFSTWYDLEDGWDYAYVEASVDGGKHWQILPGQHTTDKNPAGNAFGPGWTGASGGNEPPQWVDEKVDLSAFAGKEILLRFEYITDDAVNLPGMLIDDIAIPELNYKDTAENGPDGWDTQGWVLINNLLEQHWLVQVVTIDSNNVRVERMPVGADGKGQLSLPDAGQYSRIMLIVSGETPVTTENGTYKYTITSR